MTTTEKREATRKRNAESRKRKEAEASREREACKEEEASTPQEKLEGAEGVLRGLYIPLWEAWSDALIASGDRGKLPCKVFSDYSGATDNSPLALMFLGFCGGFNMGSILAPGEERDA